MKFNKYSKSNYSKLELSNLELEIIVQALNDPKFRLVFDSRLVEDTSTIVKDHQKELERIYRRENLKNEVQ